jgi:hypothetical protein
MKTILPGSMPSVFELSSFLHSRKKIVRLREAPS